MCTALCEANCCHIIKSLIFCWLKSDNVTHNLHTVIEKTDVYTLHKDVYSLCMMKANIDVTF